MEKQVAKKEETKAVSTQVMAPASGPHIGADDLLVPKILCLQAISEKVKDKNSDAEAGEFRDTIENKLFGSSEHPFDFIPLHMVSFWVIRDITENKQGKFIEQVPIHAGNENWERNFEKDGRKFVRVKTYETYVILPEDVKKGDDFPYVLSFRMTSLRAGKTLLTQMYVKNAHSGKKPYAVACELSAVEKANDQGDFFVQNIKPKRAATPEEIKRAEHWVSLIQAGAVKKDDSDLETVGGEEAMKDAHSDQF